MSAPHHDNPLGHAPAPIAAPTEPPALPLWARALTLLISIACLALGAWGVQFAARILLGQDPPQQLWFILAFDLITFSCGVIGVLLAAGKFREAPATALLCIGGCVFIAGALYEPGLIQRAMGTHVTIEPIAGVNILPIAFAHMALGLLPIALAAILVLLARPARTVPHLARGLVFTGALAIGLAASFFAVRRGWIAGWHPAAIALTAVAIGFLFGGLFAAAAHYVISAFIAGLPESAENPDAAAPTPANPPSTPPETSANAASGGRGKQHAPTS